jgi:VanZ family protein
VRGSKISRNVRVSLWLAVVGWMGVIFAFSSLTSSQIPGSWNSLGSLGHFGEYAILGALLLLAFASPQRAVTALAIASAYGVTDELHQLFVPGRQCDPVDWLVDTAGAAAGVCAVLIVSRWRSRNERSSTRGPEL